VLCAAFGFTWAWFAASSFLPVVLSAAALCVLLGALVRPHLGAWPRPRAETLACLALAVAYRAPALVHPAGFVNKDGAYMAFAAASLRLGERPAPAFTEGANYQGTLKAHLAAAPGFVVGDDALLLVTASLFLALVAIAATMALARRIGGPPAALAAGLYLAIGPKFATAFQLNCVGQYVDVMALGGLALALLARLLDEDLHGAPARFCYLGIGVALGAAVWQQPVALSYVAAAGTALVLRGRTWRDPWILLVLVGAALGALPALCWNVQHDWATREILGQSAASPGLERFATLPHQAWRTLKISFPILAGVSPEHPWLATWPDLRVAAAAILPVSLLGYLVATRGGLGLRGLAPRPALLPLLLALFVLAQFWAVPSQRLHWRPRYLLPLVVCTALFAGVSLARLWARSRPAAALVAVALLANHAVGTLPRLGAADKVAAQYAAIVAFVEGAGVRAGYADFSLSAPVTMLTRERVLLSPELGPTPYYVSPRHADGVRKRGAAAFVLRPQEDADAFDAGLRGLGVSFTRHDGPVTVFTNLSQPVPVEEARGYLVSRAGPASGDEESE
jgi:hypothetical protein